MNIRDLKLFKHLSGTLHFGQSSRACHVTPSALTRIIQRLEDDLGERLFLRDNRSVRLTPAGESFRSYADDVIQRYEMLQGELSRERVLGGEISLYCSVTAAYSILPVIFQKFRFVYPEVNITLETGDAALALTKLQNREVDITVAALPDVLPERVEFLKIVETPLVFIGPTSFPERTRYQGREIDWQKTPLIIAEFGLSRDRTDSWFREKDIVPNVYAQVAGNEAIIAMVALGCGVGVVPELVLEKSPLKEQIEILAVRPELKPFSIGICSIKKKMRPPQVDAFWEIAASI
ncbi:transcriptional regulator [Desulfocapsa sulfexigens DSM 10523]|uniref:Transcriptional regulator n=1 Tax=Desulfocapsa sulfexigens (strain DSM 10523 / SB164P1) TaxID=1167006 RepID=M1NAA2_DESSD|nr:HTH-type transcriptional activator IlvY [Desulfocapsa sulfexigens]AGF76784.1 transcriptional regulator [Desulfocapsa sulfexigens DSM 10523]